MEAARVFSSNVELANDYRSVTIQDHSNLTGYPKSKSKIENASVDIKAYYQKFDSLADLEISGVNRTTMELLEEILSTGVTAVREKFYKMVIEAQRQDIRNQAGNESRNTSYGSF